MDVNKWKRIAVGAPTQVFMRLAFIVFFLLPICYLIVRMMGGVWSFPALYPQSWNFRGVEYVVANRRPIFVSLFSSLTYSLLTIAVSLLCSIAPARVLALRNFRGKIVVESLLLAPLLIPAIVFSLGLYPILLKLRLTDNIIGVVFILSLGACPYMLRALIAGFESYGQGLETVAWMLGAGRLRRTITIHIPQLLPAILSGSMVVFLVAFTEYFLVFLIGGGLVPSFSGYLVPLLRSADWGISSILSLVFLVLPVGIYSILDRLLTAYYQKRSIQIGGIA